MATPVIIFDREMLQPQKVANRPSYVLLKIAKKILLTSAVFITLITKICIILVTMWVYC